MATYFAELDSDSMILRVIVADQAFIDSGSVGPSSAWIETSPLGVIRKNYARIGGYYDKSRDAFIRLTPPLRQTYTWDEAKLGWVTPLLGEL